MPSNSEHPAYPVIDRRRGIAEDRARRRMEEAFYPEGIPQGVELDDVKIHLNPYGGFLEATLRRHVATEEIPRILAGVRPLESESPEPEQSSEPELVDLLVEPDPL